MNTLTPKKVRHARPVNPGRDWLMVLIVSAIALAGILVWNAWAFDTVAHGGIIGTPATNVSPALDPASLETIHSIFAERAAEEQKYLTEGYEYADPSL